MSNAPHFDIDVAAFWADPYPDLARMRREAPIAFVPQFGSTVFTRRDDIFSQEKRIDIFSSHQPAGLMNNLMGHNMMRKDGDAHMAERAAMFPAVSPRTVRDIWRQQFQAHADRILDELAPKGRADLCKAFALPLSAECLKDITGLTNMRFEDMDAWSQAMIDGIANYTGKKEVEARCHAATSGIDAAIDDMIPVVTKHPNASILSVLLAAGMPDQSVRANIKLAISGGQNEPRDAISGTVWALLTHPGQLALLRDAKAKWLDVFEEYARWIAPIDRDVAAPRRQTLVLWRRRFRAGGSGVLHVRLGQPRRGLLCRSRCLRHHPEYPEEHRLRRRPALLRRRLCLARNGRRRGAAGHFRAIEAPAA
jgi:cytochrome P450